MFARIAVPVVVGISLLAGATLAAGPKSHEQDNASRLQYAAAASTAEKCTSLGQQTATAIKEHASSKKIADARMLNTEGSKLCGTSGKQADGIMKYEQALRDLGVKPQF